MKTTSGLHSAAPNEQSRDDAGHLTEWRCAECDQAATENYPMAPCFSGKHYLCLATDCEMIHGEKCPKPDVWPSPEWMAAVR